MKENLEKYCATLHATSFKFKGDLHTRYMLNSFGPKSCESMVFQTDSEDSSLFSIVDYRLERINMSLMLLKGFRTYYIGFDGKMFVSDAIRIGLAKPFKNSELKECFEIIKRFDIFSTKGSESK